MSEKSTIETVSVRRSPKFLTFFLFGAALGAIVALFALATTTSAGTDTGGIPLIQLVGFFVLFAAALGGLLGLLAAIIADRRLRRSVRLAEARRTVTREKPAEK